MNTRREFLEQLCALASSLALDPFEGISTERDLYTNARLGLSVERPGGWEFSSIADFTELRKRQVLLDALPDEPHPLRDPENLPAFIFEASHFRQGHFVPAVVLYDEPLFVPVPKDQAEAHAGMLMGFSESYDDFAVVRRPRLRMLRGISATQSAWSYRHELEGGEAFLLMVKTLLVFREPRVHTYHMVDDLNEPRLPASIWDTFVSSIRYSGA